MGSFVQIGIFIIIVALLIISLIILFELQKVRKESNNEHIANEINRKIESANHELAVDLGKNISRDFQALREEISKNINDNFRTMNDIQSRVQREAGEVQDKRLKELNDKFSELAVQNDLKLEQIRKTMEEKISSLQDDNNKKIEEMRKTVDEKLQETLNERISQSFKLVSERLEQVHSGLGEMQQLASGVGDLKKVLSNVKTRGVLGEIQLEAILEQILSPEQYEKNFKPNPESNVFVEFAVKLPGNDDSSVYLPIDAKFPGDSYHNLMDAYDSGDKALIDKARKNLVTTIKAEAKDVSSKYISPPYTTDFAIMFLPTEGLYAEIVQMGMIEFLLKEYKVNIAGPTTMAALLSSLQMGFKTLAIQKRSSEVWDVLSAVKTEFGRFQDALVKAQNKIRQADSDLETLVGTRTRVMQRKLKNISDISDEKSLQIITFDDGESDFAFEETK